MHMAEPLNGDPTTAGQASKLTVDEMLKRYEKSEVASTIFERDYRG
jgi:hypothetical protein